MTAATAVPPEVGRYLAAVRAALADLPAAERDDLLAEVEASLAEAAADTGGPLETRLGSPQEFAAELRAAAGLQEVASTPRESRVAIRLRELLDTAEGHPAVASVGRLATELAPIWWVARAYIAVGALAYALDVSWSTRYPVVPRFGSAEGGLVVIVLATAVSVALGLWLRRHPAPLPRLVTAFNIALALAVVPVVAEVTNTSAHDALVVAAYRSSTIPDGIVAGGVRVDNIYPYSRDGRLLHDVLLYDGAGRPLELRWDDPNRRLLLGVDRNPIFNSFPIRYYEPGTSRVERPNAAPVISLPKVATPPLRTGR